MPSPTTALVALHGDGGGAFQFARLPPFFSGAISFHAPSLPGFGGMPRDPRIASLRDFADLLAGFLIDLDPPRVLLGHGLGAAITSELLSLHPQLVAGAILHDPPDAKGDGVLPWRSRAARRLLLATPGLARQRRARDLVGRALAVECGEEWLERVLHTELLLDTPGWLAVARSTWKKQNAPALLLCGKKACDPGWSELLPRAERRDRPEWGRFPMMETPADYARTVEAAAIAFAAAW
jgi:pimeloyl-ACP methyl ester carboxylesterase